MRLCASQHRLQGRARGDSDASIDSKHSRSEVDIPDVARMFHKLEQDYKGTLKAFSESGDEREQFLLSLAMGVKLKNLQTEVGLRRQVKEGLKHGYDVRDKEARLREVEQGLDFVSQLRQVLVERREKRTSAKC